MGETTARGAWALLILTFAALAACQTPGDPPSATILAGGGDVSVLGPSDLIEVRVFGEPELSGVYQVSAEGDVRLPLIGDIAVAGLSPEAAQAKIEDTYNEKYLRGAQVSLLVKAYNARRVHILGQVSKPGTYSYEPNLTVIGAIALAGGFTRLAVPSQTLITRGAGEEQTRITVDAGEIQRGHKPDVSLKPGDIIFIPESIF